MVIDKPHSRKFYELLYNSNKDTDPSHYYLAKRFNDTYENISTFVNSPQLPKDYPDEWKTKLTDTKWKEVVPKMKELRTAMKEHSAILLKGDEAVLAAVNEQGKKEGKGPIERGLSRYNHKEAYTKERFEVDMDTRMLYYDNNVQPEMFDRFAAIIPPSKVKCAGKDVSMADLKAEKENDFNKIYLVSKEDGSKLNEGYYFQAYNKALDGLLEMERLRDDLIKEVKASKAYKNLPDEKAKNGYLAVELAKTYKIEEHARHDGRIGVHEYYLTPVRIKAQVDQQKAKNQVDALPEVPLKPAETTTIPRLSGLQFRERDKGFTP